MKTIKNTNGIAYKFVNRLFILKVWKVYNLYSEERKNFLFQFNRYENGFCTVYLRLFKKYSFYITDIKLKQGKKFFIGNREN